MQNNVICNVKDLDSADRRAIEHVIGQTLRENQQVVINVMDAEAPATAPSNLPPRKVAIPAWWNVYEGLSDEEIDSLDDAIRQRADLTRISE